ncbi:MAG TPA: NPCBM/NEW2 domain-containing protein, partial [Vicinamibacterales bacterium]
MKGWRLAGAVICAAGIAAFAGSAFARAQEAAVLQQKDPPPDGVWVSSLDLSKVALRPAGRGAGGRGQTPPATPPPPPVYAFGGVTYPNTVPLQSDRDMMLDLKGKAVRFASMVGIDDSVAAGRGSVIFGVWVDGKKVADSGLMKGGDAPKLLSADLKGARRLVLAVIDGNDGIGGDSADWGGALVTMAPGAQERPEIITPPAGVAPSIASSRSSVPLL